MFPELLRSLVRFLVLGMPDYQRRLFCLLGAVFSLLTLIELAIYYKQPTTVGDISILAGGVFFLLHFAYLTGLSAVKLRVSPLVTLWTERAAPIVLRFVSLAILGLAWYSFHLSGQY